ncbi:MAG TPA: PD-(D/E)XK nuclease family protein, partial [Bryobacteraceae bacterium]|nr:PD-(D/E)XK nuclease family protein [Bryobacteraceae bacterium]
GHVVLDGFFTFSPAELELINAIASRVSVTATLPDWSGAETGHARLLSIGFEEQRFDTVRRAPRRDAFCSPTLDRETEEIARRILEHGARGRRFREIGVILRTRDPYQSALEATFARFGIPSRAYFSDPVESHAAIRFLAGVIRALLGGWDHAELLALIRMPLCGVGATADGDAFDFALREQLPGAGLPLHSFENPPPILERMAALSEWRKSLATPVEWSERLGELPKTLGVAIAPEVGKAWREALDVAAVSLSGIERLPLDRFWRQTELGLALDELRVTDRRRDVVHVMDAYEARQWELPVVFVCGMVERHFPQYHREDPLLSDAARRNAGMRTSEDRQVEEKLLFELAMTRATEETVLSYARYNDKGEETLRSFFLGTEQIPLCETRVRPRPSHPSPVTPRPVIQDDALRADMAARHTVLSPSSLDSFLQCPFQFFGRKTLRLRLRPPAPRDRLDVRLQGNIMHSVLADPSCASLLGVEVLNQVFDDECRKARVPWSYRAEAVRLELLRNFEAFLKDRTVHLGWPVRVEEKFRFALNPQLSITGRIDRLEIGPGKRALVIDYKYSQAQRIRQHVQGSEAGDLVQAGIYLLAAERALSLEPAGMLFCGVRDPVTWGGWHAEIAGLEKVGTRCTPDMLRELMADAERAAMDALYQISSGHIEPRPRDVKKCKWCDFRDICRVEETAAVLRAGGAQE